MIWRLEKVESRAERVEGKSVPLRVERCRQVKRLNG